MTETQLGRYKGGVLHPKYPKWREPYPSNRNETPYGPDTPWMPTLRSDRWRSLDEMVAPGGRYTRESQ